MRTYLDPTAPIASDALLTDDPKAAMDLAVAITDSPRMSNLAHGLWGYHGTARDGAELTIQSLGIGGPSAAAVMADLSQLGVRRAIRIGSCIALDDGREPGSTLVASAFEPADGAGITLAGRAELRPDSALTDALAHATGAGAIGLVRSTDIVARDDPSSGGAIALDLSSAAFAAACARGGIDCACALVVAESPGGTPLGQEMLEQALLGLGTRAVAALSAVPQASGS
jgi:uridine phosphorylase